MRNPYIIDRPLDDQDHFFGREREIRALEDMWQSGRRLVLLYGKPHIGKTSLLNQLAARLGAIKPVLRVEWSESAGFSGPLVQRISWAVLSALEGAPARAGDALAGLRALLAACSSDPDTRQVYVAIDGLGLGDCTAANRWSETVAELQATLGTGPVALILSVEARPEECEAVGADTMTIVLSGLSQSECEDLVLVPARGSFTVDLDTLRRIYALTGGEPHLVQIYGHILFNERAERGWAGLAEAEKAIDSVADLAAPQFSELWERCTVRARIMLCIFAESIGTHGFASADDVRRRLQREGVEMPLADVERGLAELGQRDLVERLGGGLYRFRNALFLRWLRSNQSLVETVRQSREYKSLPRPSVPPLLNRRVDWVGLSLWAVIALLVVAVSAVWRARETRVTWTDAPPTPSTSSGSPAAAGVSSAIETARPGQIAYIARAESGHQWDIYLMQEDGSERVRLTRDSGDNTGPAWSPDGRYLAFASDRDGNREIYVMRNDGSEATNITQDAAEDWTPAWSPDGERIAFASFRDGNWEIYIMRADGTDQRRLTQDAGADYAPAWSPDGERIAFVSDRSGNLDIYLVSPDGTGLEQWTTDPATDQAPAWSPDGRQLAWESYRDGNMEIMAKDLVGGEPRNLTQDVYADDHGGSWSPDGKRIAFFSNRDGGWDIYTLDLTNGTRTNLTRGVDMEQAPAFRP